MLDLEAINAWSYCSLLHRPERDVCVSSAEELPDYVMVLVVNKKSREQMEDNLVLFLQEKTTVFVEWLLAILGRLQTMSLQTKGRLACHYASIM